jgi:hypothetical protein
MRSLSAEGCGDDIASAPLLRQSHQDTNHHAHDTATDERQKKKAVEKRTGMGGGLVALCRMVVEANLLAGIPDHLGRLRNHTHHLLDNLIDRRRECSGKPSIDAVENDMVIGLTTL